MGFVDYPSSVNRDASLKSTFYHSLMNLNMISPVKQQWIDKTKYKFVKLILNNQKSIDICLDLARSIHNFALSRSPLSLIEGGVRILVGISQSLNAYSHQFFNSTNGWEKLIDANEHRPLYSIFEPTLKQFPFKQLPFKFDNKPDIGIYTTPCGNIGFDKHGYWFQFKEEFSKEVILQFFIDEKMKKIKSKFFSIVAEKDPSSADYYPSFRFDLQDEEINRIDSDTADQYLEYFKSFLDKNIERSFLFTGPPGSGKTTLTHTIIDSLGFKTLKFKYDPKHTNLTVVQFLVKTLGVEAIVLDDFDQVAESASLLEFLAWIHDNTKLVLLVTNTVKPFHPAILRPGRVDKILKINHLDEVVVRNIFGKTHPDLIAKIKHWPIAFINELYYRFKANPNMDMDADLEELEERVKRQVTLLK